MTRWLSVIGVGDDGIGGLTPAARALLETAEIVVGPPRTVDGTRLDAEIHHWSSPLKDMVERILGWRGRQVAILATGDPMHFGIGATLSRKLPFEEMTVLPAPSAFSLAAARLGWPLQEVETVSAHGRPPSLIVPFLAPGTKILALTGGSQGVREIAALLVSRGFGDSRLTVLEHMGGEAERRADLGAREAEGAEFAEFNTLAIDCVAGEDAVVLPRVPGLPDEVFRHDGQLTKREVRAVTLAALAPLPGAHLWDVGAGCGSVAIEWMRAARGAATAFEQEPERLAMIAENAAVLGTPDLHVVAGKVPDTFAKADPPAAVFLGGAVSDDTVFKTCWGALPRGGRLVANAVTLEGEAALIARHAAHGGELVRMEISRADTVGRLHAMRPRMAVTQWRAVKP